MNAELLAMLGSVPGVSVRMNAEPKTLLSFKAGKMNAELQRNGKYLVTPDPRRGTLEVTWTPVSHGHGSSGGRNHSNSNNNGMLKLEWKDRRTRAVVDSIKVFPEDQCSYTKVVTGPNRDSDRVYLLQFGNQSERRFFFWMQEKEEGNLDEENCVKINTYMADPAEAAAAARGEEKKDDDEEEKEGEEREGGSKQSSKRKSEVDSATLRNIVEGLDSETSHTNSNTETAAPQVDALSNILENLGMPQPNNNQASSSSAAATSAASDNPTATPAPSSNSTTTPIAPPGPSKSSSGGGLTLSDLQGAMAGLATTSPPTSSAFGSIAPTQTTIPPLSEVATPDHIITSGILSNETVKQKLISLLPESQRSEEYLMTNLRSAQVTQCLKSLTAALCDDDAGSGESFNSILANFQLRPEDGAIAMASGNPVQAFLDCVLKSVQREQDEKKKKEDQEQEEKEGQEQGGNQDGDTEMKE